MQTSRGTLPRHSTRLGSVACAIALLLLTYRPAPVKANPEATWVQVTTGHLPPYASTLTQQRHNQPNGHLQGIAVDVVNAIMEHLGTPKNIDVEPWARVIEQSTRQPRLSFPLARVRYREPHYHWIGPIMHDTFILVARASVIEPNTSLHDHAIPLSKDVLISTNRGSPLNQLAKDLGFTNIIPASSERDAWNMFEHQRAQAWLTTEQMFRAIDPCFFSGQTGDTTIVYRSEPVAMYITAPATPNMLPTAKRWQSGIDQLKASGQYQQILTQSQKKQQTHCQARSPLSQSEDLLH